MSTRLKPKLLSVMKTYNKEQFIKDVIAGLIVAIIALPLSIALAISSGVSPEQGLYTAIIAGFFISLLGGSRVQIGGPSATFMVVVYGVVATHGTEGLLITTILAGIILILFGLCKLGSMIKYIPYPITVGFTSGIAVTIFSSQIKDFFGMNIGTVPTEFIEKWIYYFESFDKARLLPFIIGSLALAILIIWPKINKKIPGSLIAIVVTTFLVSVLKLDVQTIGSQYANLSSSFPMPSIPHFTWAKIQVLLAPAFTIAFLCSMESLLSAVVSDGMIGSKHRSNMELVAEGIANIASGLFGGMPATGAIARTVANIKNGGRTPIAGIIHALTLLFILLVLMPLVKLIPLATLAAILIMVSYNMSEWRMFKKLLHAPKSDVAVLLTTFFLTVLFDLTLAISIGMVLSSFLFLKRMTDVTDVYGLDLMDDHEDSELLDDELKEVLSDEILVYEINGPFFFGAADKFLDSIQSLQGPSKVLIIRLRNVPVIDATAVHALDLLYDNCERSNTVLVLSEVADRPYQVIKRVGLVKHIGRANVCRGFEDAITRAKQLIA
ncbi:sulfate permease [Turicibacter sanguinis]|uniref:SulP family inorganic anion transporter n=1 Tax=Turicibacter sanguinis TaxID=154288 RepID=UPI00232BCF8D|nr:sulfate permease [Turicibacter sanguinis]MDB8542283.1 sulfate permease [Turicibacter sanguinis]